MKLKDNPLTKSNICREARRKYGMEMPIRKLARIVYEENKLLFKDFEDARIFMRYIEGKQGKGSRDLNSKTEFYMEQHRTTNPYNLPVSDEIEYLPYPITGHKRIGVMSDIHVPYHNMEALTDAISFLKNEKIDGLLLNGDTIDCHLLSRFTKNPKMRDFKGELDTFKALIEVFKKEFNCRIYFKLGNHEERYEKFLLEKAHELIGVQEFEFQNILKARAEGIEVIGDKRIIKINSLNAIHGHEYIGGISAPVNIARGLYLRGKTSAFQGHNHSTSEHTETDMNGKITTTWSVGCLSELHPAYMPLNKWNHGVAVVDIDTNGDDYQFRNKRIFKGKVL
jgi:predicted phosphodiesterase